MARLKKASILSIALLLVTVAAGFLGGMVWQRSQAVSPRPEDPVAEEPPQRGERQLVIDKVGLEPAKRAEVEEILRHFLARKRDLDDEFEEAYRPRLRDLYRGARDSIKSTLAPEQRALYDSLLSVRFRNRDSERDSSSREHGGSHPEARREH